MPSKTPGLGFWRNLKLSESLRIWPHMVLTTPRSGYGYYRMLLHNNDFGRFANLQLDTSPHDNSQIYNSLQGQFPTVTFRNSDYSTQWHFATGTIRHLTILHSDIPPHYNSPCPPTPPCRHSPCSPRSTLTMITTHHAHPSPCSQPNMLTTHHLQV